MNPEYSLQDVVRCHYCETQEPPLHCESCNKHLCYACEKIHLSDLSKKHKVVQFELRGCITKCKIHSSKMCEKYCEKCNVPICAECISTEHRCHEFVDVVKKLEQKRKDLQRALHELRMSIYPKYEEIESNIPVQAAYLDENSQKLTTAIIKHGEYFHREIDKFVQKLKSEVLEMKFKQKVNLNKHKCEIKQSILEINMVKADLKKLLKSSDVSVVSTYKAKNAEFRGLPSKPTVTLPIFTPHKISKKQFGFLTELPFNTDEHGYTTDYPGAASGPPERPLVITALNTEYGTYNGLCNVSCLNDKQLWTCSFYDKIMRLYNLQGELVTSTQTKSGNFPHDIAVTRSGDLCYTDYDDGTVNIVKNSHIETIIRLWEWKPLNVCSTSSGDLLVVMISDEDEQTKVVRYSGSTEKQTIQYNDKGELLYSSGDIKYITENRNFDVCVSDSGARAVVVVNQAGKLRFTYVGPSLSTEKNI